MMDLDDGLVSTPGTINLTDTQPARTLVTSAATNFPHHQHSCIQMQSSTAVPTATTSPESQITRYHFHHHQHQHQHHQQPSISQSIPLPAPSLSPQQPQLHQQHQLLSNQQQIQQEQQTSPTQNGLKPCVLSILNGASSGSVIGTGISSHTLRYNNALAVSIETDV